MPTDLAGVVLLGDDGSPREHAGREVGSARFAACFELSHFALADLPRAREFLKGALSRRVLGEDADCHLFVLLSLFRGAHTLEFHKGSGTFFITLSREVGTLL